MLEPKIPSATPRCSQCGAELPPGVAPEHCPKCLLRAGLGAAPIGPHGTVVAAPTSTPREALQAGQQLGHYRIVRPLGGGGMGSVFEAEDLESGRFVALKLLSHSLDSPEARERFFREGRLAASINHPNSVYVFGTEEIAGTPAIAMELLAGGTLQDRVSAQGPMTPAEAVDAALQIIAGLQAAQRIGILHRDIKP
jgi:eukaryotic-like serine/threonine-protein kinase